jgi:DNA-binding MarR family transcriptional regulator
VGEPNLHPYFDTAHLVQACQRRLMDAIEDQLSRAGRKGLTAVQALLLFSVGDRVLSFGELEGSCYFGSNASYNVTKLVDNCFLKRERSRVDCRQVRIELTAAGREVRDLLAAVFDHHIHTIAAAGGISPAELSSLNATLVRLERFWTDQVRYRL